MKPPHVPATVLALLLTAGSTVFGATPDDLAARILAAVGRPVGLAHLPRCGEGKLALSLAAADRTLRLHGQDADYAPVQAARRRADEQGLFGRRVWFDQGDLTRLLPAGRSVDLLVLADLKAGDLTAELAAEIRRVLHPWFGVAVLGSADGAIDADALRVWAGSIYPDVKPMPGNGALIAVKAEALPGADDWPQWWHGPDNNAVSRDTAFQMPATVQWTGKPYFAPTRIELPVIAGGRLFMLWNGFKMDMGQGTGTPADAPAGDGPVLMAQAVGSGARLWMRRLSPASWVQVSRSILIADGDGLLAADGNRILDLDAASGKELRQTALDTPEIKWMALQQGQLFILGGTVTEGFGQRSEKAVVPFRSSGRHLIALNRKALRPIWRVDREAGRGAFDPRSPAIDGDRLFVCTEADTAEAYAVADGRLLWKSEVGFERMPIQAYEWDRSSRHPVTGYAMAGVYVISGTEMKEAVVLSQEDGRRLWTMPTPGPNQVIPLSFRNLLWHGTAGRDPLTGAKKETIAELLVESCSRATMAPFAEQSHVLAAGAPQVRVLRGNLVADGLLWKFPSPCTACTEWRGFIAQAPREDAPALPERLHRGADAQAPEPSAPHGWLTYRGNAQRSLASPASIPPAAAVRWDVLPRPPVERVSQRGEVLMDAEFAPAPPLIADRRVLVARGDGTVDALDLQSGAPVWRAYTSGRIQSCPAVWMDRVFVGSGDGHLYAFALADGRELWRLRVAPEAGRIMAYEQIASRWPILGAPIVAGDKVVVSAGLIGMIDSVCAVCIDAGSGRIGWERNEWAATEEQGRISGGAQFALGDELFYHGGMAPPIRIDPGDGACRPAFPATAGTRLGRWDVRKWKTVKTFRGVWGNVKGQDVGVLSPEWICYGGRRILTDQAEDGNWRSELTILGRDREGQGRLPAIQVEGCESLPAWDERDVVLLRRDKKRFHAAALLSREKLFRTLEGAMPDKSTAEILALDDAVPKDAISIPSELISTRVSAQSDELFQWRFSFPWAWSPVAWALTPNAALVVATHPDKKAAAGCQSKLYALNRADGTKRWEVDVQGQVIHSGLAVASDGSIVLALVDGRTVCVGAGP